MSKKLLSPSVLVLAAVGLVLLTACGTGGQSQSEQEASPSATQVPQGGATVDAETPLVEYQSPDKGYSVGYPEGWEVAEGGGAVDSFISRRGDGRVAAQLTVACFPAQEDWTTETLMTQDARAAQITGGFRTEPASDVEVAGNAAKLRRYSVGVSGLSIEHIVAYLIRGDCGWRIGLNSYGAGTLEPYVPLFERILDSVRFE